MKKLIIILSLLLMSFGYSQKINKLYNESLEMLNSENYLAFEKLTAKALELHPTQPTLLYNYAIAKSKNAHYEESFRILKKLLSWNTEIDYLKDENLRELLSKSTYRDELKSYVENCKSKKESSNLFATIGSQYHIEDFIICDEQIIFTEVPTGRIIKYDLLKNSYETLSVLNGSALSIIKGNETSVLYATSSNIANYEGYDQDRNGESYIYKINIETGEIISQIKIDHPAIIGSMVLSKNNVLYISNSLSPEVFVLTMQNSKLIETIRVCEGFNLQGIDLDIIEEHLFVADYIKGILKIKLSDTSKREWLTCPHFLLKGIDGISLIKKNEILAIQNGSNIKRLLKVKFSTSNITSISFIDNNIFLDAEPTNGKLIGKSFYYNATSQWPFYNKNHEHQSEKWVKQTIRELKID